jgi:hypothetical protein
MANTKEEDPPGDSTGQEMKAKGLTWQRLEQKAQDQKGWRRFIDGLFTSKNTKAKVSERVDISGGRRYYWDTPCDYACYFLSHHVSVCQALES